MKIVIFYENKLIRNLKNNKYKYSEEMARVILKNEKLLKRTVFIMGSLMFIESNLALANPTTQAVEAIDRAGSTLLNLCQQVGYWGCLVGCFIEVGKDLLQQTTRDTGKTIAKYVLAFATFYFLPWIFDIVKVCFS